MPEARRQSTAVFVEEMHQRRVRRLLVLLSLVTGAVGLLWGVFFALRGAWFIVAPEAATVLLSAISMTLGRNGRLRSAAYLQLAVLYLLLCFGATVLDIPTPLAGRSIHQFLLSLGVVACLLMRNEPAWPRHGIPLICLLTYAFFACTGWGWESPYAIPDTVRVGGVWINQGFALLLLFGTLHVIQTDVTERNGLETELREALVRGEMLLHYQPQIDADGRVIGAEALVRWNHPRRGLVPPGEFIPVAEHSGLMLPLGDWVLRAACAQLVAWSRRPQTAALVLAVNVSASQFAQPDFVARVLASIEQSGADPSRLKLELTESMLARDLEDIVAKMVALKRHGIGFSLDDFGTGFSSLSYLRRLPLDQLKIDQSFVRDMLSSPKDAAIAQTVVALGRSLGLQVIAEGVETHEQRAFLAGIGCVMYQGYLFSKPLPSPQFETLVARESMRLGDCAHPPRETAATPPGGALQAEARGLALRPAAATSPAAIAIDHHPAG